MRIIKNKRHCADPQQWDKGSVIMAENKRENVLVCIKTFLGNEFLSRVGCDYNKQSVFRNGSHRRIAAVSWSVARRISLKNSISKAQISLEFVVKIGLMGATAQMRNAITEKIMACKIYLMLFTTVSLERDDMCEYYHNNRLLP